MIRYLFFLFCLPLLIGLLLPLLRREGGRKNLALVTFLLGLGASVWAFFAPEQVAGINLIADYNLGIGLNALSKFILIFVNLFGFLISLYSKDYTQVKASRIYFSYLLWLVAFSNLVCLSSDFITFIFSWGATLVLLYALLSSGSRLSAQKALGVLGLADFSLILGICLYIVSAGTSQMPLGAGAKLVLDHPLSWAAFILMLTGALAKAGSGPFHTWIPAASEDAAMPVMAILPGSLDKLLGIYLLARICQDFFILNNIAMGLLLLLGALTIIFAVLLALMQHDLRKLLAYHAISQAGYMVLGFGTGTALGFAGALFHMVNNAIYKSGLFLTGGAVGQQKKTFELEKLGGLARYMPVTFACGLVFALSISGIPPLSGFASKWMLYQGALVGLANAHSLLLRLIFIFALVAAMFGSALTLASFIKFIHAIFLGEERGADKQKANDAPLNMRLPLLVLAGLCILLGVVPLFFLKHFISPWIIQPLFFIGSWNSILAFILLGTGLLLGMVFFQGFRGRGMRQDGFFIGGEEPGFGPNFPATEFYRTIEELPMMQRVYRLIKFEALDLYNLTAGALKVLSYILFIMVDRLINLLTGFTGSIVLGLSWVLRKLHTGVLDLYLAWALFGLIVLFFILMAR